MAGRHCNRNADILLQGFMKPQRPRRVAEKKIPVVRACDRCRDWHSGSCRSFQKKKSERAATAHTR